MSFENGAFSQYTKLEIEFNGVRSRILREIGQLPESDLEPDREDFVVLKLMKLAPTGVEAQFNARFAKKEETPDTRGAHGPFVSVVYHIPVVGNLGLLGYMPTAADPETSIRATYSGTRDSSDPKSHAVYTSGYIRYELPADMDPGEHKSSAVAIASELQSLVQMVNDEVGAFLPRMEGEIRATLAERRERQNRTGTTLGNLDVPLID